MTAAGRPETPRVGLVGYGLAGAVFHAPLIAATAGLELVSVVTGNAERAAQARREHPGVNVLDRVESLWASAADHDLVVIAAPNRAHVPLALAAIEAGLAVVVDKPLAATPSDGQRVVAAAAEAGVMLTVFHNRRWDGDMLTVRRLIAEGAVGQVIRFESRFERWRPGVRSDAWREDAAPEDAGGLLYDLGSHLVDQALVLFGRPTHVYAEVDRRRPDAVVDDDDFIALAHPDGIRAHLSVTSLAALPQARMRVLGLRGAYVKYGLDPQEEALKSGARPGQPGWGEEPPERWGQLATEHKTRPLPTVPGAYEQFYAGVVHALKTGAPPPVDPMDAVVGLEVLMAAFESARTGAVVPLPEP